MFRFIIFTLVLSVSIFFIGLASAQNNVATPSQQLQVYDCTGVKLEEIDPNSLTKAEQLALLDGALLDSVDRYSSCINQVQNEMASGGSGGSNGGDGQSGNTGSGTESLAESIAQEANDATEVPSEPKTDSDDKAKQVDVAQHQGQNKINAGVVKPKDNDAIICQILYDAIATEQDTATKDGLKAQYKDYKCGR